MTKQLLQMKVSLYIQVCIE